jgi:4-oxalocrotonate tautomerase
MSLSFFRGGQYMPYINVKVGGPLTADQRRRIAREFCETLEKVANKPKNVVYIVFDEVDRSMWAVGDELLTDKDARLKKK